jgi:L-iditol 2-dehydrogenase
MKQAVLISPGRLEVVDAPLPEVGAGQALVAVLAAGICGSDLHMFKEGSIGGIALADAGGPLVPGHECMGRVERVGAGADPGLVGRRVFIEPAINCGQCRWCLAGKPNVCPHHTFLGLPGQGGCLAQYIVHPTRLCEPLPDDVSDDAGVLLEPLAIAVHSLDRLAVAAGSAVAVLGAGPIGLVHTMLLARDATAPLIVTDVLDYRLELARRLGATHVLNPRREDVPAAVAQITGGDGADFVFECAGQPETFEQMVRIAAPAGRVGVLGIHGDDRLPFTHSQARRKGLDVLMIRRANLTFGRALTRLRDEHLPADLLATHHWPLEKCQQAFETAAAYRDGVVKGIIRPWE